MSDLNDRFSAIENKLKELEPRIQALEVAVKALTPVKASAEKPKKKSWIE